MLFQHLVGEKTQEGEEPGPHSFQRKEGFGGLGQKSSV